jgi:hypothetical protein
MPRRTSPSSTGNARRQSRGLPSSPAFGTDDSGRRTQETNPHPSPRLSCSRTCFAAAKTCSRFAGRTRPRAARVTHHGANEWRPGICAKPKVRCGACQRQAFVLLDLEQLLAHLRGQQVVGIYPLLADDTTRLLAIDLDGDTWRADAKLLFDVCRSVGVEPAVERSRSGNGAHVWFFFTEPVPAADARRLGFAILTSAMARGAAVGVESYDRLFPSQDVLPTGGFGNLIALPLQRNARQHGNTEFPWRRSARSPRIASPN